MLKQDDLDDVAELSTRACGSQTVGLRGCRSRLALSRTSRRHSPGQGGEAAGTRTGNWLTRDQASLLPATAFIDSIRSPE